MIIFHPEKLFSEIQSLYHFKSCLSFLMSVCQWRFQNVDTLFYFIKLSWDKKALSHMSITPPILGINLWFPTHAPCLEEGPYLCCPIFTAQWQTRSGDRRGRGFFQRTHLLKRKDFSLEECSICITHMVNLANSKISQINYAAT